MLSVYLSTARWGDFSGGRGGMGIAVIFLNFYAQDFKVVVHFEHDL
jgi:hypothetical protein